MRSVDWIKINPRKLPSPTRMMVCNGASSWAVDGVHKGDKHFPERGGVFAFTDKGLACALTHYAPIAMPFKD